MKTIIRLILILFTFNLLLLTVYAQSWKELRDSTKQYLDVDDFDRALVFGRKALIEAERLFNPTDTNYLHSLLSVAELFNNIGNIDSALYYQGKHLKLCREAFPIETEDLSESINNMGLFLFYKRNYEAAEPLMREAIDMRRRIYKGDHPDLAGSINNLALFLENRRRDSEAEPLYREALEMRKRYFKGDHIDVANSLRDLANFLFKRSRFEECEPFFMEALEMKKRLFGNDHPEIITSLNDLSYFYSSSGLYNKAESILIEALDMSQRLYKGPHPKILISLNNMAVYYNKVGRYSEAEQLYKQTLDMARELFKTDHTDLAICIDNMSNFLSGQGKFIEAEPLYIEALNMRRRLYDEQNPNLAKSIFNTAKFFDKIGRISEAEPLYLEALKMFRSVYGNVLNQNFANSLDGIANFMKRRGRFSEAEAYYKESVDMFRKLYKTDNSYLASSITNLALFLTDLGRYTEAEPLLKEALDIRRRLFKGDHLELANSYINMGYFLKERGYLLEAEEYIKEALSMDRRIYKGDHPDLALAINNLALFLKDRGSYSEAEKFYIESLEMYRRIFKGDNADLARSMNNMADFLWNVGKMGEAEKLFLEALAIRRRLFKDNHPDLANTLHNLGTFYDFNRRYPEAEKCFDEALNIFRNIYKKDHPHLARTIQNKALLLYNLGKYSQASVLFKEALDMVRRLYGIDHPSMSKTLIFTALNMSELGQNIESDSLINENIKVNKGIINNLFPGLSEIEKAQFWNTFNNHFEIFNTYAIKRETLNKEYLEKMFDNILFTKGILLNSTKKVRNRILSSRDTNLIIKFEEWQFIKSKIAKYQSKSIFDPEYSSIILDSLYEEANNREKILSRLSEDFASEYDKKTYNWKDVRNVLDKDEAAIEMIRFRWYDKELTNKKYYAALIIRDTSSAPELVLITNGSALEGLFLEKYRELTNIQRKKIYDIDKIGDGLRELYKEFWEPISIKLEGIKSLYFAPDGVYNLINLNTLINPGTGRYAISEIDLQLVSSTRDLVTKKESYNNVHSVGNSVVLYGDPKFNLDSADIKELASHYGDKQNQHDFSLPPDIDSGTRGAITPLPGTRIEIDQIAHSFENNSWKVYRFFGQDASENAIKIVNNPRVLHIATHGKFLSDSYDEIEKKNNISQMRKFKNSLLRSMLLFAGSENTFQGEDNDNLFGEDGLLTAYEAQNLNLDNTELVVLSACETGLGEVKNGEGVYGLQRAFQVAGAKSLIMSLWSVSDQATQELMTSFYNKWLSGKTKRDAFREAQIELKQKYPGFYHWGAFVMVGE